MDETRELFNRIKRKDKGSFDQLTENYGWKLYSYIRGKVKDREQADRIFNDTLARFHASAEKYQSDDPIEAMLCLYADEISESREQSASITSEAPMGTAADKTDGIAKPHPQTPVILPTSESFSAVRQEALAVDEPWSIGCGREFHFPDDRKKTRTKKTEITIEPVKDEDGRSGLASFFYVLCVILLVLGILAAVWFLVGILVSMQVLPAWDLGYNWFNEHVIPWF